MGLSVCRPQGGIVNQEGLVDFSQALENGSVARKILAHLHEGTDDEEAYSGRLRAVQDGGGHQSAVFGESAGRVFAVLAAPGL
jgi:hypothetical protein